MSTQGVNSQARPIQAFQTQNTGFTQPAAQQQQQNDPLAALTKALEALEKAVQALSSNGFNNNQSVASQAGQNLGTSGASQAPQFDFSNLFSGGSTFDTQSGGGNAGFQPQVTNNRPAFMDQKGGGPGADFLDNRGGGPGNGNNFNVKSGGGGFRPGSDSAGL